MSSRQKQRSKTQSALIEEKIQETKDTCTLRLHLDNPFSWEPGQFIMVQAIIDDESVRRAYSISSSPTKIKHLDITVRQTEDPTMSKYLNEVEEELRLQVRGPYGRFIWTENVSDKLFMLGAGSGITPLKAFCDYMRDNQLDNPAKLLYTCGHGDNVIFKDELEQLDQDLPNLDYELSLTREPEDRYPETRKGRMDLDYLRKEIKGFEDANYYLCGTPGFVKAMKKYLKELGIERDQIKREQWN